MVSVARPLLIEQLDTSGASIGIETTADAEPIRFFIEHSMLEDPLGTGRLAGEYAAAIDTESITGAIALSTLQDLRSVELSLASDNAAGLAALAGAPLPEIGRLQIDTELSLDLESDPVRIDATAFKATLVDSGEQIRFGDPLEAGAYPAAAPPPLNIDLDLRGNGTTPHEVVLSAIGEIMIKQGPGRRDQEVLGFLQTML
jgi:hypothetical protein